VGVLAARKWVLVVELLNLDLDLNLVLVLILGMGLQRLLRRGVVCSLPFFKSRDRGVIVVGDQLGRA
jgi:hypothetical protein